MLMNEKDRWPMHQVTVEVKEECIGIGAAGERFVSYEPRPHMNHVIKSDLVSEALAEARRVFADRYGSRYSILSCAPMSKDKISFIFRPVGAPTTVRAPGWVHKRPGKPVKK